MLDSRSMECMKLIRLKDVRTTKLKVSLCYIRDGHSRAHKLHRMLGVHCAHCVMPRPVPFAMAAPPAVATAYLSELSRVFKNA